MCMRRIWLHKDSKIKKCKTESISKETILEKKYQVTIVSDL